MRYLTLSGLVLCLSLVGVSSTMAANASCDEAKALLEKAVALVKSDGDKAYAKFMDKNGGFVDRDLYVFVMDKNGIFLSHAVKPALLGKSGMALKDADGKAFVEEFFKIKDKGEVSYRWANPVDNKVDTKTSYIQRVGPEELLMGVGCYKE